jgi:hypothetical protein
MAVCGCSGAKWVGFLFVGFKKGVKELVRKYGKISDGRNLTIRFQEDINVFKNNSHSSKYAKHLIEQNHTLDSIQNMMQVLQYQNKETHLNTYKRFHIYAEYISENHLNDEHTIFPNKLL